MSQSIAELVAEFLKAHPKSSNQDLYEAFPQIRPNTLRHYKSKFAVPAKGKAKGKPQDLEARLAALEKRVTDLEKAPGPKNPFKEVISLTTDKLDKVLKELEENIFTSVKNKVQSRKKGDFNLDELQSLISGKVAQFLASLKKDTKP